MLEKPSVNRCRILVKPRAYVLVSFLTIYLSGCASNGETQDFTHTYKLEPSESYMSGEEKCEEALEDKAKKALGEEELTVLDAKSAMKIDMKTGKSHVECTIQVAKPEI
jgi:hypothetical protein